MADVRPRMIAVHDGQGRMAIYVDESVGQDAILSRFAPRYQRIVVRGEPCTIFFDKHARSYCIGPVYYKQELMNKPGRYDYITDLDWLPNARPASSAGPAGKVGPAAPNERAKKTPHPPTSWSLFVKEKWDELRKANPNISFGEVSTQASCQWKALSEEEKASYQEQAVIIADEKGGLTYHNSHSYKPAKK